LSDNKLVLIDIEKTFLLEMPCWRPLQDCYTPN